MAIESLLGFGLWFYNRLPKSLLPIILAAFVSLIDELLGKYFAHKFHNSLPVYYVGNCLEFACFSWFIAINIDSVRVKRLIGISCIVYALALMVYAPVFFREDIFSAFINHRYFVIAYSFLLSLWSIFYFKNIFDRISKFQSLDIYVLLIVSGILFYYAFSTIFFTAQNYLVTLAIKENPHFLDSASKIKSAAIIAVFKQFTDVLTLLYITNILLYTCIFIGVVRSAFANKKPVIEESFAI